MYLDEHYALTLTTRNAVHVTAAIVNFYTFSVYSDNVSNNVGKLHKVLLAHQSSSDAKPSSISRPHHRSL